MDWFKIRKYTVGQGYVLLPCLFNLYAEYIIQKARPEDLQAGIMIPGEISITSDKKMIPLWWQKVKMN